MTHREVKLQERMHPTRTKKSPIRAHSFRRRPRPRADPLLLVLDEQRGGRGDGVRLQEQRGRLVVLHQGLPGAQLHEQHRGEPQRRERAVEPLAVGGEAELHGRAERRPGLPQRHGRQRHGVRGRGRPSLLLARAALLGPDAGLDPQDALLEVVVRGGRLGGGRALLVGHCFRGVLAGGGRAGRERQ